MKRKELMWIFVCFALSLFIADVWAVPVPDTGQVKCYNVAGAVITCPSPGQALYGQDGNYSINTPSYTKLDGSCNVLPYSATSWVMVRDNVTGLIWENKTDDGTIHDKDNAYTWYDPADPYPGTQGSGADTKDFLDALNSAHFGGYSDWRLPTIKELMSIVNHGIPYPGPTIDTGYFSNTAASWHWSSTTYAYGTGNAWYVNFNYGYDYVINKDAGGCVRAVRGGLPGSLGHLTIGLFDSVDSGSSDDASTDTGSYTDNGDGTVTDTSTGLRWQQAGSSNTQTWVQALAYCMGLNLGGYTDWRLPTSKELQSLVDYSRYNPAIYTTYFSNTAASWYWSSTTYASDTSYAWLVFFDYGYVLYTNKNGSSYVRAVRGGQPASVISVSPGSRDVAKDTGTTKFSVSNTGTGSMLWTAAVTPVSSWLSIKSGASGTNSGTINCGFTANTGASARTATIQVTATTVATGSPVDVTVTQAPTPMRTPGVPIIGKATAGNAQATVNFTPPVSNGGSPITGYTVMSSLGGVVTGSGSPITITGLTNGTAYTFKVTATNAVGTSQPSASSNSVIPRTTPDAPTIGTATAGNAQATVNFTPPASNGGSQITGYTLTSSLGGAATGRVSPITITGLTNGVVYTFMVTATNSAGTSPPSASSNSVIPCTTPDAPTIGTATAGNAQATVNFTPPTSDGGSPITGYLVTSSLGGTTTGSGSPITITGLTNGTAYTFIVNATNAAGSSPPSASSNGVTPFNIPGAPTIGTATAGNAQATVNFTPPVSDGGGLITGYTVTSNPDGKTATGSGSPITIAGLTNGTAYTFMVTATNAVGSSPPSSASNSVTPFTIPDTPTIGAATAGNALATVKFTPPAYNGGSPITGYIVTSDPGAKKVTGSASPIVVSGLTTGAAYTFVVTATNAAGTSPPSAPSNSVTPFTIPDAPIIGTATAGNALATVNFTPPVSNGGSPITGYTVTSNPGAKTVTDSASPIVVSGLTNGLAYTFVVIATNAAGSSPPSSASNSVTPFTIPDAPTIGTATADNALATVNFTPPASNGGSPITGYTVTSNPGAKMVTGSASPIVVSGLTNGAAYTFVVTATNAAGNSPPSASSNSVTPCTVPGAPTIGAATAGNAQATVNFTPPASNGGSLITGYTVTSNPDKKTATNSASPIVVPGLTNDTPYTFTVTATNAAGTSLPSAASNSVTPSAKTPIIGSNSIDEMDVVKITDMSGLLPDGGRIVNVKAWDKDGKQLTEAGYAPPLSIINHGTSSISGRDLGDRFPDDTPAAYTFSVESSKMFITNVNNSIDGAVKVPIIYSNGLSNFVSNSIGTRNTLKLTDMSGTIASGGITITVTAWDASGKAIPESTSAAPLKLYSHGTTTIAGSTLMARFLPGAPITYEFTIASPKLVISNVKNSSEETLNIPTVYTVGVRSFVSNNIGSQNTIYISDFSGTLIGGAAISVRAWDVSGMEIPESVSVSSYKIFNYGTVKITGAELGSRFSSGSPMTYEFTVDSSKVVITNVKSSSDGSINIPTVYTSGITNYTTNYVSDLNTIRITDMSGGIPAGGAITITARDGGGILIPESGSAVALKLNNHGTTTIEGNDLRNRFPGGTPVTYEFSIGSPIVVVTNLTESTDGTINIPAVFTIGPCGGI